MPETMTGDRGPALTVPMVTQQLKLGLETRQLQYSYQRHHDRESGLTKTVYTSSVNSVIQEEFRRSWMSEL